MLIEEYKKSVEGVCATCGRLVLMNDRSLIACEVRDKFILPDFPPAHGNCKCKDWERRNNDEREA